MVSVIFTPRWFFGFDIIFEFVAVIVTFLIALYSYKLYKFTEKDNHKYFAGSFIVISLAFLAKILSNLTLVVQDVHIEQGIGSISYAFHGFYPSHLLYAGGFFMYRLLFLMGLLGIHFVVHKYKAKKLVGFSAYLIMMLIIVTTKSVWAYPLFYLTAAILLLSILQYYFDASKKKKMPLRDIIVDAFGMIMLGQIIFILVTVHIYAYILAETVQLLGFGALLYTYYLLVLKKK